MIQKTKLKQWLKLKKRVEKPDKIVDIVEKILEFNRQNQDEQSSVNWIICYVHMKKH